MEALKQNRYHPLEDWQQALLIFAVSEGFAETVPLDNMDDFEIGLFEYFKAFYMPIVEKLQTGLKADEVLYAVGMKSNDAPYFELAMKAPHVVEVGDCKSLGKVAGAVHTAYFAALAVGR